MAVYLCLKFMSINFSGKKNQNRSFRGQNLAGANFYNADIRGVNFTGANLQGVNFIGVKTGLKIRWVIFLIMISCLLSGISGFLFLFNGIVTSYIFSTEPIEYRVIGWVSIVLTMIIFAIILSKGIKTVAIALTGTIIFAFASGGAITVVFTSIGEFSLTGGGVIAFAEAGAAAFAALGTVGFAVAGATAFAGTGLFAIAAGVIIIPVIAVTAVAAITTGVSGALAGTVVIGGAIISTYISWLAIKEDKKYTLVHRIAISLAALGGTNFHNADLTDADFTSAILKNTDFSQAKLTRTRFYSNKKSHCVKVDDTILADRDVLNLLFTGNGRGKSYAGANLRGANLRGADLKEANLKDADIREATFQGACLEWANLTLTQAMDTNFTNAMMSGACIEGWNIQSSTKLDSVDCRFVYLRESPKLGSDDRERRPCTGEFRGGEFTKLFADILNTIDLIFHDGIDWNALIAAWKNVLTLNEYTDLAIQSLESKSEGVVIVKVAVPGDANKVKIHNDFMQNYQVALLAEETEKDLLDERTDSLLSKNENSSIITPWYPTV